MCVCGSCKTCRHRVNSSNWHAKKKAERDAVNGPKRKLPVAPLLEFASTGELRVLTSSHIYHWMRRGWVSDRTADQVATALGFHPAEIWRELWWEGVA